MKRDWELIRKIILKIESQTEANLPSENLKIEGYTSEQINYHAWLIVNGQLANGSETCFGHTQIARLTQIGSAFADVIRSEERWTQVTKLVKERSDGSVTLDILMDLLKAKMPPTN